MESALAEMPAQEPAIRSRKAPIPVSLAVKLKVKNLYLFQDAPHARIAKETGLTLKQVGDLIFREQWTAEKRERERVLTEHTDARAKEADLAIAEAIGSQAEEIALSGLDRARDAVKRKGKDAAKNFQSWTGGIRNLVSAIKTIRPGSGPEAGAGSTLNIFLLRAGDVATDAKPVTEIAPKSVQ